MPNFNGIHYDLKVETSGGTVYLVLTENLLSHSVLEIAGEIKFNTYVPEPENVYERCATEITMEGCNCER